MMISKNSNRYNKGFSIIEICIVCVIIMVVMVPVFTLLSQGNAGTVHNRNEIIARSYAANVINYLNSGQLKRIFLISPDFGGSEGFDNQIVVTPEAEKEKIRQQILAEMAAKAASEAQEKKEESSPLEGDNKE